jgi:hypothetical protein
LFGPELILHDIDLFAVFKHAYVFGRHVRSGNEALSCGSAAFNPEAVSSSYDLGIRATSLHE